jgi:hypothetical protein
MSEENRDPNGEQEKSEKLMKRAFRQSQNMLERTTCQRILQATFTTKDRVIIENITIAVGELEKQQTNLKIKGLDFALLKRLARVNSSLQKATFFKDSHRRIVYSVPWTFEITPENFKLYIKPWYQNNIINFWGPYIKKNVMEGFKVLHECGHVLFIGDWFTEKAVGKDASQRELKDYVWKKLPENCPKCGDRIEIGGGRYFLRRCNISSESINVVDYGAPRWSLFFEASTCLKLSGLQQLKASFEAYAKEICLEAKGILSNWVSPNIYDQMMKLFMEKEKREEKGAKDENLLA